MNANSDQNVISYVSDKIRNSERYELSMLWPLIDDKKAFVRGVLLLAGVQRVKISHTDSMLSFYQIDPDGRQREILVLDEQTHGLSGAYSSIFIDTVKAIFSLECILDSALLLPPKLRYRRLSDVAEGLNISPDFIVEVSKRY